MSGFDPRDDLERSLYNATVVLLIKYDKTRDEKFRRELEEFNEALANYSRNHECAGGEDHNWDFCASCHPDDCKAPDADCQNFHTVWCPTCLGCREEDE